MGKSRNSRGSRKEHDEIHHLREENQKLKRQLNRLRKQIARVDMDKFQNIREVIEAQQKEDDAFVEEMKQKKLIEHWQCFKCGRDYLRLIIIYRPDGDFYFRRCPTCNKRTKLKKLEENVVGPPP
ncbi:MAG: hypothetical protein HQK54_13425 [Oligoflexales bacterium]|nr:hypothetical protein [Oligoflexales bacterium]